MNKAIKIPKIKSRATWGFNPITKVTPSIKVYNRKKSNVIFDKIFLDI